MSTDTLEKIRPFVSHDFATPDGKMRFSASCFGGIDWSLKNMYSSSDAYGEFADQLRQALQSVGAQQVYMPTPTKSNAVVGSVLLLTSKISLCDGIFLRRNKQEFMDGTFLHHKRDAGAISAGGCGLIGASYRRKFVWAHGSRESLMDRTWVITKGLKKGREHISVIDSIIEALEVPPDEMDQLHIWPLYFINPEDFAHHANAPDPAHAEYNRSAIYFLPTQFGKKCGHATSETILMNLPGIAKMQGIHRGVPPKNIHMEQCFLPKDLPTTRGNDPAKRYLGVIVRNS
jgi:hypothetical protein